MRRYADALDGDGGAAGDSEQHARRRLHLSTTIGRMGMIGGLRLYGDDGEVVVTAVKAESGTRRGPKRPAHAQRSCGPTRW